MTSKLLLVKALVWRLFIAIPVSMFITNFFANDWEVAINTSIVGNIIGTILYYIYDSIWLKILNK
tara:strand:- start:276 stop:470 length:195 start_codon:yes stop_codon:yes gene_type:complete